MDAGHSNVFVKNLPSAVDEPTLKNLFQSYGSITSCRVMRTRSAAGHNFGFVRFSSVQEAMAAIEGMNGAQVGELTIEVKFADADVGQRQSKGLSAGSAEQNGLNPSDNLYVRGFPSTWSDNDLKSLFTNIGSVVECRVLHSKEPGRGGVGLVRMAGVEEAARGIETWNGQVPAGCGEPLLVKYADSAADKERKAKHKQSRDQRYNPYQKPDAALGTGLLMGGMDPQNQGMVNPLAANGDQLGQLALQGALGITGTDQTLNALALQNPGALLATNLAGDGNALNQLALQNPGALLGVQNQHGVPNLLTAGGALAGLGGANVGGVVPGSQGTTPASVYVRNLPPEADKLYLYEKFAPYGGVTSVKLLFNDAGDSRGIGFVNYVDQQSALKSIQALHGSKVGDKSLHVSLQTQRKERRGR